MYTVFPKTILSVFYVCKAPLPYTVFEGKKLPVVLLYTYTIFAVITRGHFNRLDQKYLTPRTEEHFTQKCVEDGSNVARKVPEGICMAAGMAERTLHTPAV